MNIKLPQEFLNRIEPVLGDEYDAFLASYEEEAHHALRLNPLKTKLDKAGIYTQCDVPSPVPWCRTGYYYGDDVRPGKHPYHEAGAYYIQEPSAMFPGELAGTVIREYIRRKGYVRVLDMCAAPGGKSTHAAGAIGDRGILVSNEPVPGRARILSQNIERMGIKNCLVCVEDPARIASVFPGFFDVILTDVPCSGEGMFRKDQTAIDEWSPEGVDNCVIRSRSILDAAHRALAADGSLIYSTCTFEPAENEGMIAWFLSTYPGYRVAHVAFAAGTDKTEAIDMPSNARNDLAPDDTEEVIKKEIADTFRLWPHKLRGEGHYAALLTRDEELTELMLGGSESDEVTGDNGDINCKPHIFCPDGSVPKEAMNLLKEFFEDTLTDKGIDGLQGYLFAYGNNVYIADEDIARAATAGDKSKRLKTERTGLHLGEVKKGRFEPSHALAMALKPDDCIRRVELKPDDKEAYDYFEGLSLSCDPAYKGYCAVFIDGCSAGWGKASQGTLKNHYPKGLRKRLV